MNTMWLGCYKSTVIASILILITPKLCCTLDTHVATYNVDFVYVHSLHTSIDSIVKLPKVLVDAKVSTRYLIMETQLIISALL